MEILPKSNIKERKSKIKRSPKTNDHFDINLFMLFCHIPVDGQTLEKLQNFSSQLIVPHIKTLNKYQSCKQKFSNNSFSLR